MLVVFMANSLSELFIPSSKIDFDAASLMRAFVVFPCYVFGN